MAIQFPPINAGDPAPIDGESYLYLVTQEEFVYSAELNAWSALGKSTGNAFAYYGSLLIKTPAPPANTGWIYSVADGASATDMHPSFVGLYNTYNVDQWSLIIYDGNSWSLVGTATGPWVRTVDGRIQPTIQTDSLDMVDGDYIITSLQDLP